MKNWEAEPPCKKLLVGFPSMEDVSSEKIWIDIFRLYQAAKALSCQSRRRPEGPHLGASPPRGRGPLIPNSIDGLLQDQDLTISRRAKPRGARSSGTASLRSQPPSRPYEGAPPPTMVGGRLRLFAEVWEASIPDCWVRSSVATGYKLEFSEFPPPHYQESRVPVEPTKKAALMAALNHLLYQGVIVEVPAQEQGLGFYSNLFIIPKPNGDVRPILDLKGLNAYLKVRSFRMESVRSAAAALQKNDFLASIDIKDAYLHVPIFQPHQRFLRFTVARRHFQFVALPFGLATAPRVFTKVLAPILANLRIQGIIVLAYLDDLLIIDHSSPGLERAVALTVRYLERFGWVLNREKSAFQPTKRLEYLGMSLDTEQQRVFLPRIKVEAIKELIHLVLSKREPTIRLCMRLLGKLVATFEAVPYAQSHTRVLQAAILSAWSKRPQALEFPLPLSSRVRQSLCWWLDPQNLLKGKSFSPVTWKIVTTDASLKGWGAILDGCTHQGTWAQEESQLPINILELRAARLALRAWTSKLQGFPVRIQSDNATAVAYINHQGGTKSQAAQREVSLIFLWAENHVPCISAIFIPGVDNLQADFLSRQTLSPGEWSLHPQIFQVICQRWGMPDVDVMASRFNKKLDRFMSRTRDPMACGADALVCPWHQFKLLYAFPPLQLLPRLLRRIRVEHKPVILVAPAWPRRAWYSLILKMAVGDPWTLPLRPDLLSQGPILHPALRRLNLTAWRLNP